MAEFKELIEKRQEICDSNFNGKFNNCNVCELGSLCNGFKCGCREFIVEHPDEAEEIIMNWEKKKCVKTNYDKLSEVFGVRINIFGCDGIRNKYFCRNQSSCEECKYFNFWKQEYKGDGN